MKNDESRRKFLLQTIKGVGAVALGTQLDKIVKAASSEPSSRHPLILQQPKIRFVIHGGAGTILKKEMSAEREKEYRAALTEALMLGYGVLKKGGPGLDAVEAAIRYMEDSPLFNAGKGAV